MFRFGCYLAFNGVLLAILLFLGGIVAGALWSLL